MGKSDAHPIILLERLSLPHDFVESFNPAVQMIGSIVGGECVGVPIESKSSPRDAIAVPPDDGAKERRVFEVALKVVEAERDIVDASVTVRNAQDRDDSAVGYRSDLHALRVRHCVNVDGFSIRCCSECSFSHGCFLCLYRIRWFSLLLSAGRENDTHNENCQWFHFGGKNTQKAATGKRLSVEAVEA